MSGAFARRSAGEMFPVVSVIAKLVCEDGKAYTAYTHEALYDNNAAQIEYLLSVHQSLRDPHNGIDDRARCDHDVHGNPGLRCARFDDYTLRSILMGQSVSTKFTKSLRRSGGSSRGSR
jgi:hypothetical protein